MITEPEIVDLQLHANYGSMMPLIVKDIVNRELDAGVWQDGYETAVTENDLNNEQGLELMEVILRANPKARIDIEKLSSVIDKELAQSAFAKISWLVEKDGSFIMTDSLRVAKFQGKNVLWCTPRISYDGIILKEIKRNIIFGLSWFLSDSYEPDIPFSIDIENGKVLSGEIISD